MELENVVPWGRSLDEYRDMFALSEMDLKKKILGCSDGPASFNAEATRLGAQVISVDPIYRFDAEQIHTRIETVYPKIMQQVSINKEDYVWENIGSIDELGIVRMRAMQSFLDDYGESSSKDRYVEAELPALPFSDAAFDLALCSHYLFLYSDHVDLDQHIRSVMELCRVAHEVRIYPLLSIKDNQESPHLKPVLDVLLRKCVEFSLVNVDYEFQKGATQMLVVRRAPMKGSTLDLGIPRKV